MLCRLRSCFTDHESRRRRSPLDVFVIFSDPAIRRAIYSARDSLKDARTSPLMVRTQKRGRQYLDDRTNSVWRSISELSSITTTTATRWRLSQLITAEGGECDFTNRTGMLNARSDYAAAPQANTDRRAKHNRRTRTATSSLPAPYVTSAGQRTRPMVLKHSIIPPAHFKHGFGPIRRSLCAADLTARRHLSSIAGPLWLVTFVGWISSKVSAITVASDAKFLTYGYFCFPRCLRRCDGFGYAVTATTFTSFIGCRSRILAFLSRRQTD